MTSPTTTADLVTQVGLAAVTVGLLLALAVVLLRLAALPLAAAALALDGLAVVAARPLTLPTPTTGGGAT